ncbi:conjugal transfer protein TraG N-terminal domain-containing protein [Vibrio lentus]
MTFEYYTYTQGATLMRALNAVAAFFASDSFSSLIAISLMFGAVTTFAYFTLTRDTKHIYTFAVIFTLVPLLLINQKGRVQIIDLTEPTGVYAVDNVPYIVAIPTWFFSTMMMGVTETVETVFNTSDNRRYGRTGMLFGSELYQLSRQADIKDIELRQQWNDFFKSCLIDDVEINGKYTWNALFSAPDIFGFLDSTTMSPIRGVMLKGQNFKTCAEYYPTLKQAMNQEATRDLNLLGTYLYGKSTTVNQAHLSNALSESYSEFVGISNGAVDVIKQNMAINAMRFSIDALNTKGQALNYAYTQNKMQQTSMWASLGMQAREFIPMMHTMMFFIFTCLSFFVAAAALIPSLTKMVLSNYVKTFAYLATWPALFAILNAIMLWTLEVRSLETANLFNGLSLKNADPLNELHERFAWMTGFLMMSIPLLAGKILSGGASAIQSLNYSMASMINSTNSRVSAAASTGNLDFGNLQMQNHSYNNTSANKFDDNLLMRSGMSSIQQSDGSTTNTYHNDANRQTYNAQETESKPLWSASVANTIQNSVNDQYSTALSAQKQATNNLNDAYSNGMQINDRWNDAWSKNKSYGDGHNISTEGQISTSRSTMESAIDNISQTMGWTKDQSRAFANAATVSGGVSLPSALTGGVLQGGIESRWSDEERNAYSSMTAEQKQAMQQASEQYNEGATEMQRAGRTLDTKENRSEMEQYAHDFSLNHQRTQSLSASVMEANSTVDSLSNMRSRMESDSSNFTSSAISGFQRYLEVDQGMDNNEVQRLMTARLPEDINDAKSHFDLYTQSDSFKNSFGVNTSSSNIDELKNLYQPNNLSSAPTLNPEQSAVVNQGAEVAQSKIEEVTADMINLKGSDDLYDNHTYRNVRGNALVMGGHMQNEANTSLTSNLPASDVQQEVNDQLTRQENAGSPQPDTGYHYTTQKPNKNG